MLKIYRASKRLCNSYDLYVTKPHTGKDRIEKFYALAMDGNIYSGVLLLGQLREGDALKKSELGTPYSS